MVGGEAGLPAPIFVWGDNTMKFAGKDLTTKNKKLVKLQRSDGENTQGLDLLVSPLPADFTDQIRAKGAIKVVEAPKKWVTDSTGAVKRDPETKQPLQSQDFDDPEYLQKRHKMVKRMHALALREALKNDPSVTWETTEPASNAPTSEWGTFADAVVEEVFHPETGLTSKEVDHVIDEAGKLALVVASQITEEAALKNF